MLQYININKIINFIFFATLFILGYLIHNDYGVSIDEDIYKVIARNEYSFLKKIFLNNVIDFKIYFNELVNNNTSKVSSLFYNLIFFFKDVIYYFTQIDYETKKIANLFLNTLFVISNICFFKIVKIRFKNILYSYLAVLILYTSPRFFAESYYNYRDLLFLSLILIFFYFTQKLFNKLNYKNIFFFSIISSICIGLRFFGIIFFISAILFLILEYENKIKKKNLIFIFFCLLSLTFFFLFILHPHLWTNSISGFFNNYFDDLNNTNRIDLVITFFDKFYSSKNAPWYYYFVWIFFTVPLSFIFFIIIGLFIKLIKILKIVFKNKRYENIWSNKNELFDVYIMCNFLIIFYGMVRLNSVHLDGWRHIYFLYPLMIFFIFYLFESFRRKKEIIYFFTFILIINILLNIKWIIKNHPFQYVYFNGINNYLFKKNFDYDYWGISNYNFFKFILKTDKRKVISIGTVSFNNLNTNYNILDLSEKSRLIIADYFKKPDYIIDNYRVGRSISKYNKKKFFLNEYSIINEIKVNNIAISTLYKKNL